ncbi:WXG100 family type VII secretion target [Kitasatospora sp. NPDC059673]|uniref:WXG100 family type VII secretion target n=1 Tax=Kitasatospora sp. NPDC059673 TaxID=3346901 RepID=UPI0036BCE485
MGEFTAAARAGTGGAHIPDLPPGTLRVSPDEMRSWAASALEIGTSFRTAGSTVDGETTDAYVTLSGWLSGPALRERSIRWDDQESTLGNLLADVADRLRRTADNYSAAETAAQNHVAAARGGW